MSVVTPITDTVTDTVVSPLIGDDAGGGGPSGDGLILEDGSGFLLLETGDYLLLE